MIGANILVVEDEAIVSMNLQARLPQLGYAVVGVAMDRTQALHLAEQHRPDLVLMDINLGGDGYDGIDVAREINATASVPVVYLTAYADPDTLRRAKLTEPFGYVLKPFGMKELQANIEMALYRSQAQRKLQERDEWLGATLRSIGEGVIATDSSGHIQFMNPVAEQLTGWRQQEAVGRDIDQVLALLDESGEPVAITPAKQALQDGKSTIGQRDYIVATRDGRRVSIVDGAAPITTPRGIPAGVVIGFRDISERKRMEEELLRSNEELQQFAYAASHDLQEPLRTVTGYSQLLARRMQDRLSSDEKEMIGYIMDGARRMSELVAGLLDYGRLASQTNSYTEFPAIEAVNAAIANLRASADEKSAIITSSELPVVVADQSQLTTVFQNLISNAIKYSGSGATVRVSVVDSAFGRAFCVADNGIGIAPRYHQKIFAVFTQLHPNRYSGTGIGLAICKRVIERHGGRIWVESDEGKGASFYFTLGVPSKTLELQSATNRRDT